MRNKTGLLIISVAGVCLFSSVVLAAPPTYTISGFVRTSAGAGVEGVNVVGNNGAGSAVTGADGGYSITVPNKWDGTITVSKPGWLITPPSRTYTNVSADITNENYTAYQPKISGLVTKTDGTPLEGATVTANNSGGTAITNATGYYELFVPYNWSGSVSASLAGYNFTDKNYTDVITDQTNQNFSGFQPTISGYVRNAGGTGLSGAVVTANNGGGSTTTDTSGYYALYVPYNWSGTLTAILSGYGFTAINYTNVTADQTNQNFSGFQPEISGVITAYGVGLEEVILTASNGGGVAVTDSAGNYNLTVPYGWSGTVTPTKPQYTFTPTQRSYSNVTTNRSSQNYTAILPPVSISGYVLDSNGTGITNVNITVSNGGGSTVTNSSGYYSKSVPYNWSGVVTAQRTGWQITPANYSYTNLSSNQVGQNFTGTCIGIVVKPDGTGDFTTIQEAIDATIAGETVVLQPGTYTGNGNRDIDFKGKAITVRGATGEPNDVIVDCQGTVITPHRGFKFVNSEDANSVLKDVMITNGYGPDEGPDNSSYGGGIYCQGSSPVIQNCTITNNTAFAGGGIYCSQSNPAIRNCTITNNTVDYFGGGINCYQSNPAIQNCTITNNSAHGYGGGGIYCSVNSVSSPAIQNCIIANNTARNGGGIFCAVSSPTIRNCMIKNNTADLYYGGGIFCFNSSNPAIQNCTITNNTANNFGGKGGGIYCYSYSNPAIRNCTITNNTANRYGGGTFCYDNSSPTIQNCIYWGNSPSQIVNEGSSSHYYVSYSDIQGGSSGTGNINLDPLFESDGYHLLPNSPCIDAGDPDYIPATNETDIDGESRVIFGRIDIGADEVVDIPNPLISGYVRKIIDDLPIVDVNVAFFGIGSTTTDIDGYFSQSVPVEWSGTMTLSKAGIENKIINFTNVTSDLNAVYRVNLTYAGGDGSEGNPYQIASAEQLYWLSMQTDHWDKSFVLVNDIDMSDPNAAGFRSIGNVYDYILRPFSGNFDGGGHTIKNLTLTTVWGIDQIGLFGYIQVDSTKTSVIKNVRLVDASVTGQYAFWGSGSLAGRIQGLGSWNVVIENCHSEGGMVDGIKYAGGLIGFAEDNVIVRRCSANTAVQTTNSGGGLVGCLSNSKLQDSLAIADVNSIPFDAGGLVGSIHSGEVSNCYVEGSVRAEDWVGGFVGRSEGGSVNNCYAACDVTVARFSGGFAGYSWDTFPTYFNACFWDTQTSGTSNGVGNIEPDPAEVMGRTTAQMQTQSTFTGWDFADTWAICEETNYPRLHWQIPAGDWLCPDGVALEDYAFLAGHWLLENCDQTNDYCQGTDLDTSGSVGLEDALIFCEKWLEGV